VPEPPLILVTNDDGVRSPGLHAAAEAVAGLGDLLLVAPADALGIPAIAAAITAQVSEWRTFGAVDWTAARHFTRLLARQVLENGMPEGVSVLNLNVPRGATTGTELRRTVQDQQPYYVRQAPKQARPLGRPYQLPVAVVVDRDRLEPGTDIHAIVCDQVASVTPLTWQLTARTDWVPPAGAAEA
jgi:5'-nucleotidase